MRGKIPQQKPGVKNKAHPSRKATEGKEGKEMETIEIYGKTGTAAKTNNENAIKELNRLQKEIESLKEWREYYEGFGLHGQASLFEEKEKNLRRKKLFNEKGLLYPRITKDQMEILTSVFNRCVPIEEFSFQSMPTEIVEAYLDAKEYKEAGVFDSIEVFYYDNDPMMIGKSVNETTGDERHYLLARWGDGLKPWEWFIRYYHNEKRARIPSLRLPMTLLMISAVLLAACLLLPVPGILKSFLATIGVACIAVSAGSLIEKFKIKKSYARSLRKPIPSPFKA